MAQKVNVILEDDLDGGEAAETVRFALDGKQYEMDLSAENAERLRAELRPFAEKARRVKARAGRTASGRSESRTRSSDTADIRRWARENGYEISDRGRIHKDIREAYYAAQKES